MGTQHGEQPPGALAQMTVLDLTQVMAGPFCTMVLADLGADVIKIENPDGGDQSRRSWGRSGKGEDSRAFMSLNRNKRSVVLDLKSDEGRANFYQLCVSADVVVENWRPGVATKLAGMGLALKDSPPGFDPTAAADAFGADDDADAGFVETEQY